MQPNPLSGRPGAPRLSCHIPDLPAELIQLVQQVPAGYVTTYGDLAVELGNRMAARWVGEFMLDHPHSDACPCHRVVRRTGELGLYISGQTLDKRKKLLDEGVEVDGVRVDLSRYRFERFVSERPLVALSEFQQRLPEHVALTPFPATPDVVAGVDLSYATPNRAVGAYALVKVETGELVWSATVSDKVQFPYISGYLAFRELPILLKLLERVEQERPLADLIFVDGHGLLHQRNAGIATHLGVLTGIPTIGIGKKLLCGTVDLDRMEPGEPRWVTEGDRRIGAALRNARKSRPIFVSPGQLIDLSDAVRLTSFLLRKHRLPEPTWWADSLSRSAARKLSEES